MSNHMYFHPYFSPVQENPCPSIKAGSLFDDVNEHVQSSEFILPANNVQIFLKQMLDSLKQKIITGRDLNTTLLA